MSVLSRLAKPTPDTPFHIDVSWWDGQIRDFHSELRELAHKFGLEIPESARHETIDSIDPLTAQVTTISALQYLVQTQCGNHPEFVNGNMSLVDAVFRALLKNGNHPMTPLQLAESIGRPNQVDTILRTLGSRQVYKGIRPIELVRNSRN
ncbi:MAG TPA: hypothetical protein PK299_04240 [Anaerolineales bacterium]|nr:hypothetical protein [Anaerolineales bacterium]